MYTLLRDEKSFSEGTVATLYATTYISAAASALFTGFLADRFGRRRACLAFCALHSLSRLTVLATALPVIIAGRVLAGVALTLLWTVFESWMVTEFDARGLAASAAGGGGVSLGSMFGVMTTSNCMAAIMGGVLGHCIVLALGSRIHPFLAGIVLEVVAAVLILRDWVGVTVIFSGIRALLTPHLERKLRRSIPQWQGTSRGANGYLHSKGGKPWR